MTNPKRELEELAERVTVSVDQEEIVRSVIEEAHELGRTQGLEEAAKILKDMTDELAILKNSVGDTERGRGLQKGVWTMFAARLRILGLSDVSLGN